MLVLWVFANSEHISFYSIFVSRLRVHTDYVTDLNLIEVSAPTPGADREDTPDIRDLSAAAQYGDCSLVSASTDKTIRLTPFSFLDMTFA